MRWSYGRLFGGLLVMAVMVAMNVAPDAQSSPDSPEIFKECAECPEMVVLPSGRFRMGSEDGSTSSPVRDVEVAAFALGRTEVTQDEYAAFVNATERPIYSGCLRMAPVVPVEQKVGTSWRNPGFDQGQDHPVTCVSWADANAYAAWLSGVTGRKYRLPSEAEWEFAARAGTGTRYYWGDDWQCGYANFVDSSWARVAPDSRIGDCDDGAQFTAPVGSFLPNAFGLHDMVGNLWEWTADCWHDSYRNAPQDGTPWTSDAECMIHVLRGGSWDVRTGSDVSIAYRHGGENNSQDSNTHGFRVAMTLE